MATKRIRKRNRKSKRGGGINPNQLVLPENNSNNNTNSNDPSSLITTIEGVQGAIIAIHQAQQHAANVHLAQNVEPENLAQTAQQVMVMSQAAVQLVSATLEAQSQIAAAQAAFNDAENYV
jgi:hypothetical protein